MSSLRDRLPMIDHFDMGTPRQPGDPLPPPVEDDDEPPKPPRFRMQMMSTMLSVKRPRWLIPGLLMEQQNGCVYGQPGSKKSFALLGIGQMLAHGMEWQGRPLTARPVVYVCGEGFPMFYQRRLAWFRHYGIDPIANDKNFGVIDGAFPLTKTDDVLHFIRDVERQIKGVGLIVFDTLSTFCAGQDENESAMMSGAIEGIKTIGRALKCATVFVHHPGKDTSRGPRGHSSLFGNSDMISSMLDHATGCTLFIEKQKDAEIGQPIFFGKHVVKLGFPEDDDYPQGKEADSLCLVPQKPPMTAVLAAQPSSRVVADRNSIAWAMDTTKAMSRTKLAKKLQSTFQCGLSSAKDRIAASLTSEWQRAIRTDGTVFEVRSVDAVNGQAKMVEMRLPNKTTEEVIFSGESDQPPAKSP